MKEGMITSVKAAGTEDELRGEGYIQPLRHDFAREVGTKTSTDLDLHVLISNIFSPHSIYTSTRLPPCLTLLLGF